MKGDGALSTATEVARLAVIIFLVVIVTVFVIKNGQVSTTVDLVFTTASPRVVTLILFSLVIGAVGWEIIKGAWRIRSHRR